MEREVIDLRPRWEAGRNVSVIPQVHHILPRHIIAGKPGSGKDRPPLTQDGLWIVRQEAPWVDTVFGLDISPVAGRIVQVEDHHLLRPRSKLGREQVAADE